MFKKLKTKTIIIGSVILMALVLLIGTTFAYFTARVVGNDTAKTTQVYAGTMSLRLDGTTQVTCNGLYPGGSCVYNFTVENTGTLTTSYELDLVDVLNDFNPKSDLVYSLTRDSQQILTQQEAPSANGMVLPAVVIAPDVTQHYTLTLLFKETGANQNNNQDKHFKAKVNLNRTDSSDYLQAKVLASHINTTTPDFSEADPVKLSTEKKESNKAVSITSYITGDKVIGTGYTFNERSGLYTLTGTTANQTYDSNSVGKYTCNSETDKCEIMYKIKEVEQAYVNANKVTKADYYTKQATDRIYSQSGLFVAQDDDGTSYYFRGEVNNNYVSFGTKDGNPLIWRIVRINGDGTLRLIANDYIGYSDYNTDYAGHKYAGYTYDNSKICTKASPCTGNEGTNSTIKTYLESFYTNNLQSIDSKIATATYCNDTSYTVAYVDYYYYGSYNRIKSYAPQLTCPDTTANYGGNYKLKIGLLSADEVVMAGYRWSSKATSTNYLYKNDWFWTGSPYSSSTSHVAALSDGHGSLDYYPVNDDTAVRPVINLKADVQVATGNGSQNQPYTIR